ncbi:hypothetical protein CHGG_08074 [Chaetomium globosum CBS 148.51]|uniref:RING-type domain-containing protein n=1 Tax=Chaetomium globosum (strain ATCC 6205 / CBS 148.51 / DSM 1962 / NBRC 6347 / NRRL 1970) TaxID=306901 RepID=Q2GVD0_CHAGB|nr:uncharacterized protein CHGG_08074 [Chaetomium globosum CBS 148.51]EAQ86821.1 hypothetical protein CHGG_08074 [Chaetomium globosum CBS 148.51]
MPPPNTPEEGVAATTLRPADDDNFRASSPSSAMAHASQEDATPFHSPITTPCGHTFCAGCINRALETQPRCPIDRQPINKTCDYGRLPLIIKEQLDRLQVRCPNKGCDYQCPREHLEGHYERRCEYTQVRCPDSTCSRLTPRRDSAVENGCLHKDAICEFCHKTVAFVELSTHYNFDCEGAMAECPECKEQVVRHCLVKHRAQDCAEETTSCKWHTGGCKVVDKRRIVQDHEQSGCPSEAVGRLIQQQVEDRKIIDELVRRLNKFELAQGKNPERRFTQRARVGSSMASSSRNPTSANVPDITLNNNMPPLFPDSTDDGAVGGSPEDYLLAQFERLETEVELLRKQALEMDAHRSHIIHQQATHFNEHLAEIGNKVGVVNMHMSWLMSLQRQSHAQQRAGSTAGSANSGMSHGSATSGARPGSSGEGSSTGESRRSSEGRSETLHRL